MKKHYTIPFFIPLLGCPHKCIFCDQKKISGRSAVLSGDIERTIEEYLGSFSDKKNAYIEAGFFGGTFTGLPEKTQKELLSIAHRYIKTRDIKAIRLSTRPDFITQKGLNILKEYGVGTIELGVQSMSEGVLKASRRGHTAKDVEKASRLILKNGFTLGHQIMVGLPRSSREDEYLTAGKCVEMGIKEVRIYPVLVIKGTELAQMWKEQKYFPLSDDEAAERCKNLILYFEANNVKVIRCGLHPSEGLSGGSEYLAGPFHPAFRQKAESRIFGDMLRDISGMRNVEAIAFNPEDDAAVFGFKGCNKHLMEMICGEMRSGIVRDASVKRGTLKVFLRGKTVSLTRKRMAKKIKHLFDTELKC